MRLSGLHLLLTCQCLESLRPFAGTIEDLSISSNQYHAEEEGSQQAKNPCDPARRLGMCDEPDTQRPLP